jgi:SAM-dependent methyltransferase
LEAFLKTKTFVYTGCENLEAMTEAVNYNRFLIGLILKQLKDKKSQKILDFGAGSGTYSKMFKEHKVKPDCLEPDKALQAELKSNGFKVFSSSNELKPNSYDLIYALNVFEHIEDDFAEMAKLHKALKKGGKLIIYVPAHQVLFSSMDRQVGHFRRYKTKRLKQLAQTVDLRVKELFYYDPIGFAAALVYRIIGGSGVLKPSSVRAYDKYIFPVSKMLHPVSKKLIGKNAVLVAEK